LSKVGFIFPGQASQYPGMGRELHDEFPVARQAFEGADQALGFWLSQLCFHGPEEELKQIARCAVCPGPIRARFERDLSAISFGSLSDSSG